MTVGAILFAIGMFIIVAVWVLRPVLIGTFRPIKTNDLNTLVRQKEQLMTDIKALQFDFETGKVPELAYQHEREMLVSNAAGLLQQIEQLPDLDGEIEKAIQSIRNNNQ